MACYDRHTEERVMTDRKLTEEEQKNPLLAKARAARVRLAVAEIDNAYCDVAFHVDALEKLLMKSHGVSSTSVDVVVAVRALGEVIEKMKRL